MEKYLVSDNNTWLEPIKKLIADTHGDISEDSVVAVIMKQSRGNVTPAVIRDMYRTSLRGFKNE